MTDYLDGMAMSFWTRPSVLSLVSRFMCPICDIPPNPLVRVVAHMNDKHKWSFLKIADWLDALEREQKVKVVLTGDGGISYIERYSMNVLEQRGEGYVN